MVNFPCIPCSGCEHGRWNCSLQHCPVHGGLSPWSSWSSCSLSCGGLGLKTRTRACSQPASAHGGRDCQGPRQETTFCQAPQCPGTGTWLSGVLHIKLSHKANNTVLSQLKVNTSVLILILHHLLIGPTEEPVLPGAILSTSFVNYLCLYSYKCNYFSHITLHYFLHTL